MGAKRESGNEFVCQIADSYQYTLVSKSRNVLKDKG
jgi:hypothetical protein